MEQIQLDGKMVRVGDNMNFFQKLFTKTEKEPELRDVGKIVVEFTLKNGTVVYKTVVGWVMRNSYSGFAHVLSADSLLDGVLEKNKFIAVTSNCHQAKPDENILWTHHADGRFEIEPVYINRDTIASYRVIKRDKHMMPVER